MNPFPIDTGHNRILIIDDNTEIHTDFRKVLAPAAPATGALDNVMATFFGPKATPASANDFEIDSAYQGKEGLELVQRAIAEGRPYAMAFVDVRMPPGWDGVETITRIWEVDPTIQIVICTAYSDYSWQEIVTQLGKSDRLIILKKPFDGIEVLQLAHSLTEKWLVTIQARHRLEDLYRLVDERTRELQVSNTQLKSEMAIRELAQEALKTSEERLARAFNASPLPVAILRLHDHGCIQFNRAFLSATGCTSEELVERPLWETGVVLDLRSHFATVEKLKRGQSIREQSCQLALKNGEQHPALLWVEPFELATGPHLVAVVQDISEQTKLESHLRQSQKMEAIGHLAAGVAHDLNNLLTVVEGHTSLQLAKAKLDNDVAWSLRQVQGAGERAAALTRQLLAFSRKQVMQKKVVSLSNVVDNVTLMLKRLIPETIALSFDHAPDLPSVYADVCNLEQIVVNLVVNARDAMPGGGSITIRTEPVEISAAEAARHADVQPGSFVRLSVTDTGEGISPEIVGKIFEPFFTTKEVGKGTGMGLATVLGIIQQHEGWIDVDTQVGRGTTFRIYLPTTNRADIADIAPASPVQHTVTNDMILLVEDDHDVRMLARCVLEDAGYRVLEAENGPTAIATWRAFEGRIDLLLTDMVMPGGLSGTGVAEHFRADRPDGKVLFSSGYNVELFGGDLSVRDDFEYLAKPYLAQQLLDAVARVLSSAKTRERAVA
jgi:PAS domain S-box-containing protein